MEALRSHRRGGRPRAPGMSFRICTGLASTSHARERMAARYRHNPWLVEQEVTRRVAVRPVAADRSRRAAVGVRVAKPAAEVVHTLSDGDATLHALELCVHLLNQPHPPLPELRCVVDMALVSARQWHRSGPPPDAVVQHAQQPPQHVRGLQQQQQQQLAVVAADLDAERQRSARVAERAARAEERAVRAEEQLRALMSEREAREHDLRAAHAVAEAAAMHAEDWRARAHALALRQEQARDSRQGSTPHASPARRASPASPASPATPGPSLPLPSFDTQPAPPQPREQRSPQATSGSVSAQAQLQRLKAYVWPARPACVATQPSHTAPRSALAAERAAADSHRELYESQVRAPCLFAPCLLAPAFSLALQCSCA